VQQATCQANWLKAVTYLSWRSNTSTKVFGRFSQYSQTNAEVIFHAGWAVYVEQNIAAQSRKDWYLWKSNNSYSVYFLSVTMEMEEWVPFAMLLSYEIFPSVVKNTIRSSL
jgi:hypothetical protein